MIKVIARSIAHPEHLDEIITLSKQLVEASLLESGCVDYGLYQDLSDPNILTMIETWTDENALEIHKTSGHVRAIVPKLNAMRKEKSIVQIYRPL